METSNLISSFQQQSSVIMDWLGAINWNACWLLQLKDSIEREMFQSNEIYEGSKFDSGWFGRARSPVLSQESHWRVVILFFLRLVKPQAWTLLHSAVVWNGSEIKVNDRHKVFSHRRTQLLEEAADNSLIFSYETHQQRREISRVTRNEQQHRQQSSTFWYLKIFHYLNREQSSLCWFWINLFQRLDMSAQGHHR